MCDTQVIRKDGVTYFAKNSDREPGEAQLVVRVPPVENDKGKKLRTTYLDIDQTNRRYGVILSKPAWIWGAEIGANDQGVVIGNEGIFSKVMETDTGLIGMDLLRLGLERGGNAEEAMRVIVELLEKYGQGGACGYRDKKLQYDNSFIIADVQQAWILETAGRHWVAQKVDSIGAISNCMTIGENITLKSDGIEDFARKNGLFAGKGEFNFKKTFDTWFLPFISGSSKRLETSCELLSQVNKSSDVRLQQVMNNLRPHFRTSEQPFARGFKDICMHAGGYVRRSQTCGSQVSKLTKDGDLHFLTGTSAPCLSIFKPVGFDMDTTFGVLNTDENTVENSLWQRHEQVHRRLLHLPKERKSFRKNRDLAEQLMLSALDKPFTEITREDFNKADSIAMDWEEQCSLRYDNQPFAYAWLSPYAWYWRYMNKLDGFGPSQ